MWCISLGQAQGDGSQAGLADRVGEVIHTGLEGAPIKHIDYGARLSAKPTGESLRQKEGRRQIDAHVANPGVQIGLVRTERLENGGAVDQNVHAPQAGRHPVDQPGRLLDIAQVGLENIGPDASAHGVIGGLLGAILRSVVVDRQVGASGGQAKRERSPKPASGSGDQGGVTPERIRALHGLHCTFNDWPTREGGKVRPGHGRMLNWGPISEDTMHDIEAAAELLGGVGVAKREIEEAVTGLLNAFGEDIDRQGLEETPARVARMYDELLVGYRVDPFALINDALFDVDYSDMVVVKNIEFYSLCEHHLIPFLGRAHVAYIPSDKVIGLSKIPRVVDLFSRRLQVQERMTRQIADFLDAVLKPLGVGVVVEGWHLCAAMRGVKKANAVMVTSALCGTFQENSKTRQEFLNHVSRVGPEFSI